MCTVTYLPRGNHHFFLTSNRDESAIRSPQQISTQFKDGIQLVFPRDTTAGGTWIAMSDTGRVVCLLNGAFDKHQYRPPYQKSRGIMVLEFFDFSEATDFLEQYDFAGMEPFTMIILEKERLIEFRWDEKEKHITVLDRSLPYIWSSATLYDAVIRRKREQWFAEWKSQQIVFQQKAILTFHKEGGDGDPENDCIMNRKEVVQTVSITSIARTDQQISLQYHDLIRSKIQQKEIKLRSELLESYQK